MKNFIYTLLLLMLGILTNNMVFYALKNTWNESIQSPGFVSIIPLIIYVVFNQKKWKGKKLRLQHYFLVITAGLIGLFIELYFIQKVI